MHADHSCQCVRRPAHPSPSRSSRLRRRVRDRPAAQHRRSPRNRETGASGGGQNRAEQHPIPIHPSGSPSPPRAIQNKLLIAISESRKSRRNSVHYPVNAGSGQKRGVFGRIKRELTRRSAIEAVIGHMKAEGHLGRCYLKGRAGDAANVILSAVGYNLRLVLAWLRIILRVILLALLQTFTIRPALKPAS